MSLSRFSRTSGLLVCVAFAAGCAGAPSSPATLPVGQNAPLTTASRAHSVVGYATASHASRPGGGWFSPAARHQALLYGSSYDGGFINIYPLRGKNQNVVGQLTSGLVSPQGMMVDRHQRLWVANTNANNIIAFKRNTTEPFKTLSDPGYYPVTVAVAADGTVYAGNVVSLSGPPGNVAVYAHGSTTPTETLTYSGFELVLGLGVDAKGDLFVSYVPQSGPPALVEFPKGSKVAQQMPTSDETDGDIIFDRADDLVMEDGQGSLGVWPSPWGGAPARTVPAFGNEPTFDRAENRVWVALANLSTPEILGYDYTTGALVDTITNGFTPQSAIPYGVAIDPSAPR
jgi:hypothetical protein